MKGDVIEEVSTTKVTKKILPKNKSKKTASVKSSKKKPIVSKRKAAVKKRVSKK